MSKKREFVEAFSDDFIYVEGLDEAIIGFTVNSTGEYLVYSEERCIEILMLNMDEEAAREFFDYNIRNQYKGSHAPVFVKLLPHLNDS